MGQAGSMWLVSETADGVAFVDQHAAHERVILERLKTAVHGGDEDMVQVSPPVQRELSSMQAAILSQDIDTLRDLGFSIRLSGDTAILDGYPSILSGCVPSELFNHLIDVCLRGVAGGVVGEALWETLATAACKAAIKAGDALDPERADRLLREIEATPNAAQCNHGRPTMIFLKHEDIARLFDLLGALDDRGDRAVDVGQDRRSAGIGAQRRDEAIELGVGGACFGGLHRI